MSNTWRFKDAVLGTYELDFVDEPGKFLINMSYLKYDYIDTSICYNNDYFIREVLNDHPNAKLISKIPPQMTDQYDFMISHHLKCLGRDKIDIMLIHNPRADWSELAIKLNADPRIMEVGVSNFSIMQINEYKKLLGYYPAYNEMEINPDYYDKDLVEFCHSKGIKIIAYAILGGKYNARRNIARFTLPYLLTFAGMNAEYVITRSDNVSRLQKMKYYLDNFSEAYLDKGLSFDRPSTNNKSIVPDSYNFPEYYGFYLKKGVIPIPTNGDKIYRILNQSLCTSFESYSNDLLKLYDYTLNKLGGSLPSYEFISDYRVLFRYMLMDFAEDAYGLNRVATEEYMSPSTYVAEYYKKNLFTKDKKKSFFLSVNLINDKGLPNKVNTGSESLALVTDLRDEESDK